ncbi:MAG: PIN/TRAM domain-containing protein [Planctomycetota bacterium]|nr:PIN/TRAM domain-containing protein [Planctomycetota bacterium]
MAAVGFYAIQHQIFEQYSWFALMATLAVGVFVVCIDILSPRGKLAIFSGTFLGLIVGLLTAYALSFVVALIVNQIFWNSSETFNFQKHVDYISHLIFFINVVVGVICSYLSISFILQTKDDFRFIIPYVEFSKVTKGARPILLDTSVLIDGRISDIAETGILESRLIVPRFVLAELQGIADSGDRLKRDRGRRGLDVLKNLQNNRRTEVILYDSSARDAHSVEDVDGKLLNLATELGSRVLTNDFNLNKVASLRGVDVININDLANALKPVVLPGEQMKVRLIKAGQSPGQGVGYLQDGTMVVVEQARQHVNEEIEFTVTSALQTSAGKMIFGRMDSLAAGSKAVARAASS